jgi:hypothetical protein
VELIYCISVSDTNCVSSNRQSQESIVVHNEAIVVVTAAPVYVSNECYKHGCVCKAGVELRGFGNTDYTLYRILCVGKSKRESKGAVTVLKYILHHRN